MTLVKTGLIITLVVTLVLVMDALMVVAVGVLLVLVPPTQEKIHDILIVSYSRKMLFVYLTYKCAT